MVGEMASKHGSIVDQNSPLGQVDVPRGVQKMGFTLSEGTEPWRVVAKRGLMEDGKEPPLQVYRSSVRDVRTIKEKWATARGTCNLLLRNNGPRNLANLSPIVTSTGGGSCDVHVSTVRLGGKSGNLKRKTRRVRKAVTKGSTKKRIVIRGRNTKKYQR